MPGDSVHPPDPFHAHLARSRDLVLDLGQSDQLTGADLELLPGGVITGRITDQQGTPMEGILVLATLGQRWRFTLVPDQRVEPEPLITLRPRYGLRMRVSSQDT